MKKLIILSLVSFAAAALGLKTMQHFRNSQPVRESVPSSLLSPDQRALLRKVAHRAFAPPKSAALPSKLIQLEAASNQLLQLSDKDLENQKTQNSARFRAFLEEVVSLGKIAPKTAKTGSLNLSAIKTALQTFPTYQNQRDAIRAIRDSIPIHVDASARPSSYIGRTPYRAKRTFAMALKAPKRGLDQSTMFSGLLHDGSNPPPKSATCTPATLTDLDPTGTSSNGTDLLVSSSPDITSLAQSLKTPVEIENYVNQKITFFPNYGATRTAQDVLESGYGTAADKSTLLIALLRASGIPSAYAAGEVYLSDSDAERLFDVETANDLANALWFVFEGYTQYYGTSTDPSTNMIYDSNGARVWAIPHVWVRAYINNTWVNLDPSRPSQVIGTTNPLAQSLSANFSVDYNNWFFGQDRLGRYVKPGNIIDELMREMGAATTSSLGSGFTLNDLGLPTTDGERTAPDNLNIGTLGATAPCTESLASSLPSQYLYNIQINVTNTASGSNVLSYTVPAPAVYSKRLALKHSAGMLSSVGYNISGNLELVLNGTVLASGPITTGTNISIAHNILSPARIARSQPTPYVLPPTPAGGVVAFGDIEGPLTFKILEDGISDLRTSVDTGSLSNQDLMERALELTTQLYLVHMTDNGNSISKLRDVRVWTGHKLLLFTNVGKILTKTSDLFGFAPDGMAISNEYDIFQYSRSGGFTDPSDYQNLLKTQSEFILGVSEAEHQIWEELFGVPGVSAVKVLQLASELSAQGNLGKTFIKGQQLGVGNDSQIFNQFGPGMSQQVANITDPTAPYISTKSFLYSITDTLSLSSGWQGVGYVLLPSSVDGGTAALFTTYQAGVGSLGGGTDAAPEDGDDDESFNGGDTPSNFVSGVCGNPVNLATGSMWHQLTDFALTGRTAATQIQFVRTYLENPFFVSGDIGPHWMHNWDSRLLSVNSLTLNPNDSGNVYWIDDQGGQYLFTRNPAPASNTFTSPVGQFSRLTEYSDHYELRRPDGVIWSFSRTGSVPSGRLQSIREPHGEAIVLSYDSVSGRLAQVAWQNDSEEALQFSYDSLGRLIEVTRVPENLSSTYAYNSGGALASSTDFNGHTTSYGYNQTQMGTAANGLLSSITDSLGRSLGWTYYDNGSVFEETEPGGATRTYLYSPFSVQHLTRVRNSNGALAQYSFDDQNRLIEIVNPDQTRKTRTYDSQNNIIATTDESGYQTQYTYDSLGNRTGVKNPEDVGFRTTTYDSIFSKPAQIVPLVGSPSLNSINSANGDILSSVRQDSQGSVFLNFTYDNFGNITSVTNNRASYQFGRDSNGLLTTLFDARNPEQRTYDIRKRLIQRRFASGRVINYAYDNYDQITDVSDTNGPSTHNVYDTVERVIEKDVTDGNTVKATKFQYDTRDRVVLKTDPLGRQTQIAYDTPAVLGCGIIDKPTQITDPAGRTTRFEYDLNNRVVREIDALGNVTNFEYTPRGDKSAVTDPIGNRTIFRYDGNRRLISASSPVALTGSTGSLTSASQIVNYSYDGGDRLVFKSQPALTADGGASLDTFVTQLDYDPLGNLIRRQQRRNHNGSTAEIFEDSQFSYERQIDTILMASASNSVSSLTFTHEPVPPFAITAYSAAAGTAGSGLGLLQQQFTVTPAQTSRIGSIVAPQLALRNQYDPAGRLTSVDGFNNGFSLTATIQYDGYGRKSLVSYPTGISGTYNYDLADQPTQIKWTGAGAYLNEGLVHDPLTGDITTVSQIDGNFTYSYDPLNQLTGVNYQGCANFGSIANRSLAYDAVGNRISDTSQTFSPQFLNNFQIADTNFSYLADQSGFGQLTQRNNKSDGSIGLFKYRPDGRLTQYTKLVNGAPQETADYFYDPLNRRVAKQVVVGSVASIESYVFNTDEDRILIGNSVSGSPVVYLDGSGIDEHFGYITTSSSQILLSDHLGSTYRSLIPVRDSCSAASEQHYGTFGESTTNQKLQDASDPAHYGFAGRQYDAETGFYYLRNRMYDPNSGRFISPDPTGLTGGDDNVYRYARNNPLSLGDPLGLYTLQVGVSATGTIWGFSLNLSWGVAIDTKGNITTYFSVPPGVGVGSSVIAGSSFQVSNASTVYDLKGPFFTSSVGLGSGIAGSVDQFAGQGTQGQWVQGAGFTLGAGFGASDSESVGPTYIGPVVNPLQPGGLPVQPGEPTQTGQPGNQPTQPGQSDGPDRGPCQ